MVPNIGLQLAYGTESDPHRTLSMHGCGGL
jgi:hypothetical protein